ncbi:hypothetical protein AAVH_21774 [Aphelenchoides avenae]|nr:hypothetical protein AAVH_21774 [Aphelenchus avenae]
MNDGGLLTFGGKDTENCDSKWTKVVSDSSENWSLTMHSFHFRLPSGETIYHYPDTGYPEAPVSAEISIASPLLTVPLDQYDDIMQRLNATRNEELDLYTVICDEHDLNKIPSIVINLGHASNSIYYTVPPERVISREVSL